MCPRARHCYRGLLACLLLLLPVFSAPVARRSSSWRGPVQVQLYNEKSRRFLQLLTDGSVRATADATDPKSLLWIAPSVQQRSMLLYVIRSVFYGVFLCMSPNGTFYTSCNLSEECEFLETYQDSFYNTYESNLFRKRYLSINSSGHVRQASRLSLKLGESHFFLPKRISNLSNFQKLIVGDTRCRQGYSQRCSGYRDRKIERLLANSTKLEEPFKCTVPKENTGQCNERSGCEKRCVRSQLRHKCRKICKSKVNRKRCRKKCVAIKCRRRKTRTRSRNRVRHERKRRKNRNKALSTEVPHQRRAWPFRNTSYQVYSKNTLQQHSLHHHYRRTSEQPFRTNGDDSSVSDKRKRRKKVSQLNKSRH